MEPDWTLAFVAVGAMISQEGGFLIVRDREPKLPEFGKWSYPFGWLEAGEDPILAVKELLKTQTGLLFEPEHALGVFSLTKNRAQKGRGAVPHIVQIVLTGEHSYPAGHQWPADIETAWMTAQEVLSLPDKELRCGDLKKMVNRYLSLERFPLTAVHHTDEKNNK